MVDVPGVIGVHHVGLAVRDLDDALDKWTQLLGAHLELRAVVPDQGVEAACLQWQGGAGALAHGTLLELIAPLDDSSGVARFLERRGEGMHHVAWAVHDVAAALESLTHAGARVIDEVPRIGLHGTPVAFLHPQAAGGVLVELVEVA